MWKKFKNWFMQSAQKTALQKKNVLLQYHEELELMYDDYTINNRKVLFSSHDFHHSLNPSVSMQKTIFHMIRGRA